MQHATCNKQQGSGLHDACRMLLCLIFDIHSQLISASMVLEHREQVIPPL